MAKLALRLTLLLAALALHAQQWTALAGAENWIRSENAAGETLWTRKNPPPGQWARITVRPRTNLHSLGTWQWFASQVDADVTSLGTLTGQEPVHFTHGDLLTKRIVNSPTGPIVLQYAGLDLGNDAVQLLRLETNNVAQLDSGLWFMGVLSQRLHDPLQTDNGFSNRADQTTMQNTPLQLEDTPRPRSPISSGASLEGVYIFGRFSATVGDTVKYLHFFSDGYVSESLPGGNQGDNCASANARCGRYEIRGNQIILGNGRSCNFTGNNANLLIICGEDYHRAEPVPAGTTFDGSFTNVQGTIGVPLINMPAMSNTSYNTFLLRKDGTFAHARAAHVSAFTPGPGAGAAGATSRIMNPNEGRYYISGFTIEFVYSGGQHEKVNFANWSGGLLINNLFYARR